MKSDVSENELAGGPPGLCGLVLAGGRSTRMGTDKAALVHPDGRTLARRTVDLLDEAGCECVVLSLRHDQEIPPGLADHSQVVIARDPEGSSEGPLAGMLAAMSLRPDADWLVLACDLPRLDVETLAHLISSKLPEELFLSYRSEFDGLPEPLCALYAAGALRIIEQARADDLRCPRKVLIQNKCRLLEAVTPRALENANTPEDWETARQP
jgi:molybdopterin-guanine dinucleotide biosynthesis protein A